jgi:hypothetical protein
MEFDDRIDRVEFNDRVDRVEFTRVKRDKS